MNQWINESMNQWINQSMNQEIFGWYYRVHIRIEYRSAVNSCSSRVFTTTPYQMFRRGNKCRLLTLYCVGYAECDELVRHIDGNYEYWKERHREEQESGRRLTFSRGERGPKLRTVQETSFSQETPEEIKMTSIVEDMVNNKQEIQCSSDLIQCSGDLTQCLSDPTQCSTDLAQCSADKTQCFTDLTVCSGDISHYSTDKTHCSEGKPPCSPDPLTSSTLPPVISSTLEVRTPAQSWQNLFSRPLLKDRSMNPVYV